jgi:flagellar biosynthesis/type III secretory pathway chaperone
MSQDTFTPRSNVNLRRIELTLISRLNQLELHLESLTEAQEQLIHTIDYLQQTSAPFLVLSYIGFTKPYLDRQRTEIAAAMDTILELIRILQELCLESR